MPIIFKKTSEFERVRSNIEQYIFNSVLQIEVDQVKALQSVEQFNLAIENFLDILESMYQTPNPEDKQGEKSFPIKDGRYRIYYYFRNVENSNFEITLLDIDDNHQLNSDRFPTHLTTFDDEN